MRHALLLALFLCAGCGDGVTIRGSLLDEEVENVWVVGGDGRAEVQDDSFELRRIPPGTVDLRLGGGEGEGEVARILIRDVPRRAVITLDEIWTGARDGLAFPSRVQLRGADAVTINGVRMAAPDRLRGRVDEGAVVLAIADHAEAILARPHDERLPDLRVVVTPTTEAVTPDGDPAPLERLATGDSIRVEGRMTEGYLVAERLTVPRRIAAGIAAPPATARPQPARPPAARGRPDPPGRGRGGGPPPGRGRGGGGN